MAKDTKRKIIDGALLLFSQKGFDATSMGEIAKEVGIKAPSIYDHFKNKQDLFDCIVQTMKEYFESTYPTLHPQAQNIKEEAKKLGTNIQLIKTLSKKTFEFYFTDKYASTFRKMLSIERFKNPQMNKIFCDLYIEAPINNQTQIFKELKSQKYISQKIDPHTTAMQYFSPFILLMNLYDANPTNEKTAIKEIEKHVNQFIKHYFVS